MDSSGDRGLSSSMEITGQIMVIAIIVLFVVVVFVIFLHLYAKWFWWRIEQPPVPSPHRRRRRRGLVFAHGQDPAFALRSGLNPAILRSIPVLAFNPAEFKDGLECAVCLSELVQGDKARLLPKCNHGFHVDCIDMWFQSHSTCPLCRNPIDVQESNSMATESVEEIDIQNSEENLVAGFSTETPNFPTNVLFWGNETQVSTGGAGLEEGTSTSSSSSSSTELVIDIPVSMSEHLSALSPTRCPEEESKSPVTTRLRSLKRLLSREKRVNPSSPSSSCDVEQVRRV
ncbi:RING-H2 finger protein [Melia azedarach]|uniref:RING-H2 finger protein n=1 Tax=Melia azedarach TaxID=155640 RepID=A0ACC1Y3H7_MELAZ|nr:RING-H2 finger protein [Melia azedarach]